MNEKHTDGKKGVRFTTSLSQLWSVTLTYHMQGLLYTVLLAGCSGHGRPRVVWSQIGAGPW